jgi:hypothetical protein
MGLLSDFFIADASPVPKYEGGERFDDADKCQFKHITPLQGGQFLAVLRGQDYTVKMVSEFKLVTAEDADDWTMTVPQDMVDALATLKTEDIHSLAAKFAEATAEELGWSPDDFVPIVRDLSALARRAAANGKTMYLWNCL